MFSEIFLKKYLSKIERVEVPKFDRVIKNNMNDKNVDIQNRNICNKLTTFIPTSNQFIPKRIPTVYKERINNLVDSTRVYSNMFYYGKLRKKQVNKNRISLPTDFRVIQHIGKDSNNELEV
jgi:hypothetical protein